MVDSAVPVVALIASAVLVPTHAPRHHAFVATPTARAAPTTIVITATDFAYTGLPTQVAAGWVTVKMVNHGRELHMLATFNIPRGLTPTMMIDSVLHQHLPAGTREWGGPNAVASGDTSTVTLYLEPGEYMFGCFVQSADGKTHFDKGMMGSVRAIATTAHAPAPTSAHAITLSTYAIGLAGAPIHRGIDTLSVRNTVADRHDLVVLRVAPGHSVADALAWFTNPPTGAPAATAVAGTTALHEGEYAFLTGRFTPGTYVLVCWMYTDGKPHHQLGMKHVFTVT